MSLNSLRMSRYDPIFGAVLISRHPYIAIVFMIAAVTAFGFAAGGFLRPANLDVLYLLVVFVGALEWGRRPALFAALASAVVFDFCFIPPYFRFGASDLPYLLSLGVFVAVGVTTSELASRAREATLAKIARAEAEAARLQLQARNEAKDALLDRISHELRAPLTVVLGRVQILKRIAADSPYVAQNVPALERSAAVLARLVEDLLDACRAQSGKLRVRLQPVQLTPIVAHAVEDAISAAASKKIRTKTALDLVPETLADPARVEQVVANLLSNAVKFTPPGGEIDVRLTASASTLQLTVSDSGVGIAPSFLPHVFEPFSQASAGEAHDGLGLGLAIVNNLVHAHGGNISVNSDGPGCGTTFVVEFPIRSSESVEPT